MVGQQRKFLNLNRLKWTKKPIIFVMVSNTNSQHRNLSRNYLESIFNVPKFSISLGVWRIHVFFSALMMKINVLVNFTHF